MTRAPLISIKNLSKRFRSLEALAPLSLTIDEGECLALVGESGSGKSTLGKILLNLEKPSSGTVLFNKEDIFSLDAQKLKQFRKEVQIIFQDPYSALNPRMTVEDILKEPLEIHALASKHTLSDQIDKLLGEVSLFPSLRPRFPHELSGGQRQRLTIARALATQPRFLVCDEPTSSLDVSIQAQVINLIKKQQIEKQLTLLFISHDLSIVRYLSTRIAVLYLGHLVEIAPTPLFYASPLHPYSQALLSAVRIPDPKIERNRQRIVLKGEPKNLLGKEKRGCIFANRCPHAQSVCFEKAPLLRMIQKDHLSACHFN